jgi:serine/threonine protein kinase
MASRDEEPFQPLFRMCKPEDIWAISKTVGRGAFGYVHLAARVAAPHEAVAIKVIDCDVDTDAELESIRREVRILRECDHANVVTFYASYRSLDMSMWIVMEYCGGGAVADLLKYRALGEGEAAYVLRETLRGLHHLHEQCKKHIIHRDLKSANLLLTAEGDVKVADFGVSKILDIAIAGRKTRSFVGTPHWMAPEVIMGKPYDARCDIWSVGIVGIEMAEQHPPKFNVNMHGVLAAIPKLPAPTLCRPQDHSARFCAFLDRVLVKEPGQRPTAMEALAHCFVGGAGGRQGEEDEGRGAAAGERKNDAAADAADASGKEDTARRIERGKETLTELITFVAAEKAAGRKPPRPRRRAVRQGGFGNSGSHYHSTNRSGNQWTRSSSARGQSKASIAFSTDTLTDENDAILGKWGTNSTTLSSSKGGPMPSIMLGGTTTSSFNRSHGAVHNQPLQSRDFNATLGMGSSKGSIRSFSRSFNSNTGHSSASNSSSMVNSLNRSATGTDQKYYPPLKHSLRPQDSALLRKQAGPLAIVEEVDGDEDVEDVDEEVKLEGTVEQLAHRVAEEGDKKWDKKCSVAAALSIKPNEGSGDEWSSDDDDDGDSSDRDEQWGCLSGNKKGDETIDQEWSTTSSDQEHPPSELVEEETVLPASPPCTESAPPLPWGHVPSPSKLICSESEEEVGVDEEGVEVDDDGSGATENITEVVGSSTEESAECVQETDWNRMLFEETEEDQLFGAENTLMPRRVSILAGAGSPPRSPIAASENLRRRNRLSFRLQEQLTSGVFMDRALLDSNNDADVAREAGIDTVHEIRAENEKEEEAEEEAEEEEEEEEESEIDDDDDVVKDVLAGGTENADFILDLLRRRGMNEMAMRDLHSSELWKSSEVYC